MSDDRAKEAAARAVSKIPDAIKQSEATGKPVNIDLSEALTPEKKKLKGKKVDRESLDGSGVDSILKSQNNFAETVNCGTFAIASKEWNEEEQGWDYEFDFDDNFIGYCQHSLQKEDGVTADELRAFAYSILLAKQEGVLEDGIKVEEHEQEKIRKVKFYKKY